MTWRQWVLAGLFATLPSWVAAGDQIGTAVRIVNKVTADQAPLGTGDGVTQNQTIEVAADSLGELKLKDDTLVALGAGARLVLDKFVFDPSTGSENIAVRLVGGAFRFITGAATKRAYKISTPSSVIAIRGTMFDVYIAPNGTEWLLLHVGALEVCDTRSGGRQNCRVLKNPCDVLRIPPDQGIGTPGVFRTAFGDATVPFEVAFPFVENPPFAADDILHTREQIEQAQCPRPYEPRAIRADYTVTPQGATPASTPAAAPGVISALPSVAIGIAAAVAVLSDDDRPASK
jgi:hypothetical protein